MANELVTREDYRRSVISDAYHYDWSTVPREFVDIEFLKDVIYAHPGAITNVPKEYLSQELIDCYIKNDLVFESIKRNLPKEYNNEVTWATIFSRHMDKLSEIPKGFVTRNFYMEAVRKNPNCVRLVPEEFQNQEMWINYAKLHKNPKDVPGHFLDEKFYAQIAEFVPMRYIPEWYQTPGLWNRALNSSVENDERCVPLRMRKDVDGYNSWGKEDELLNAEKAIREVHNNPSRIFNIPYNQQSQDLWNYYVMENPRYVSDVPREFQTQEMWEHFAQKFDDIYRIPEAFRSRKIYERMVREHPERVEDVPLEYQTVSMWEMSGFPLKNMPDKIKTERVWQEIIAEEPQEFFNMPKEAITERICKDAIRNSIIGINDVPESVMSTEILDTFIIFNRDKIVECMRSPYLKRFATKAMYDSFLYEVNFSYKDVASVPEKFQTKQMWDSSFVRNESDRLDIMFHYMPLKFQDQEKWNTLANRELIKPEDLKEIPSQFREGVEKIFNQQQEEKLSEERKDILKEKADKVTNFIDSVHEIVDKYLTNEEFSKMFVSLLDSDERVRKMSFNLGILDEKQFKDLSSKLDKEMLFAQSIKKEALAKEQELKSKSAAVVEEPVANPDPVVKEEPVVAEPVVNADPTVTVEEPAVKEEPVAVAEEPVVNPEPAVKEEPGAAEPVSLETGAPVDDVKANDSFEEIMKKFAQVHASYYDGKKGTKGNAHTKEEIALKNKINRSMRKYLQGQMTKIATENNLDQVQLIDQLSNAVSPDLISQLVDNKGATLKLMEIMSSGVFIRNGERIRLSQKQRVALAETMAKVSEQMLQKETKDKSKATGAVENILDNGVEKE